MFYQEVMWTLILFCLFLCEPFYAHLYPEESETRQVKSLNGIWLFNFGSEGFKLKWYEKDFNFIDDYSFMPVPSSFNEIPGNNLLRDYLGWVWYQRQFFLGKKWSGSRIFVYFGAVDHHAIVWCNGVEVGRHSGGHIPFHLELTKAVDWTERNLITVAVNNTLTPHSLPQGYYTYPNDTSKYPPGTFIYTHNCDYFDYSGINRNVFLYSVPHLFIKDIDVITGFSQSEHFTLKYNVILENDNICSSVNCSVGVRDFNNKHLISFVGCKNDVIIRNENNSVSFDLRPWLPEIGNLFSLEVNVECGPRRDVYRKQIGFRNLEWGSEGLKVNGLKLYLKGFGMHEDADIRGRGYDDVTAIRDIELLKWSRANAIRTSHYPYSEEFLMLCDFWGISVILEVPACSLDNFTDELYREHERITVEIVSKYKNHPSIIMWSLANEPASNNNASLQYFSKLYNIVKTLDPTRPVSFVTSQSVKSEKAMEAMDVILINRYSAWYQNGGRLDLIQYQIRKEITAWRKKYNKPVVITEYGSGALPGSHELFPSMWTEDYQVSLLQQHFEIFNELKEEGLLSGEMIWNLIDFKTPQEYFRPGYCMKGIFTRQREPKAAANIVRNRYSSL